MQNVEQRLQRTQKGMDDISTTQMREESMNRSKRERELINEKETDGVLQMLIVTLQQQQNQIQSFMTRTEEEVYNMRNSISDQAKHQEQIEQQYQQEADVFSSNKD